MGLDLDKVPQEYRERAGELDKRLTNYEKGRYHNFGNKLAGIVLLGQNILDDVGELDRNLDFMRDSVAYLDAIYDELDFSEIELTEETACFFVCRDLYPGFRRAFEMFEESEDSGKKRLLRHLLNRANSLVDVGRSSLGRVKRLYFEFREITGSDREEGNGNKVPRDYECQIED